MAEMFKGEKYSTSRIVDRVPLRLQEKMWSMICAVCDSGQEVDYLQVFKLSRIEKDGVIMQGITNTQEVPEYENTIEVPFDGAVNEKIFVICDIYPDGKNISTMLLAEEY